MERSSSDATRRSTSSSPSITCSASATSECENAVVAFALFYLVTQPQGAAEAVRGAADAVRVAFESVIEFITALFK